MGMMTMEELTKAMLKDFGEEIDDANKYCDMAKAAEELGWDRTAEGFYEMARDKNKRDCKHQDGSSLELEDTSSQTWESGEEYYLKILRTSKPSCHMASLGSNGK